MAQLRSVEEIRRYLNIDSISCVRRLIRQGHLPHYREGPKLICSSTELLDEWIVERNRIAREAYAVIASYTARNTTLSART